MNCGQKGHKFRECSKPILSFGIACFIKNSQMKHPLNTIKEDEYACICIQRRHTYSYVDYLRGKYNLHDIEYQKSLLERMTQSEQRNLYRDSFEVLWKHLWMEEQFPNHITISNKYKQNAKYKHIKMKERWFKEDGTCMIQSRWESAEWGLPKGRRNRNETNHEVAKREFQEETGIDPKNLRFLKTDMVIENYVANNGHHYNNLYRVAVWNSSDQLDLEKVKCKNKNLYSFRAEISQIKPMSYREIMNAVRKYETWKEKLFETCFSIVRQNG